MSSAFRRTLYIVALGDGMYLGQDGEKTSYPHKAKKWANSKVAAFEGKGQALQVPDWVDGRYGFCHVCNAPIIYPGLDRFYCPVCKWHDSKLEYIKQKRSY